MDILLGDIITRRSEAIPGKTALIFKEQKWTFAELDAQVNQVANGLQKLGLKKGDRVGLLSLNSPYFVISYFAIVKLGAVVVPINVMFKGDEVKFLMNDAQASMMIVGPAFIPLIQKIKPDLNTVKKIVAIDIDSLTEIDDFVSYKKLFSNEPTTPPSPDSDLNDEEVAVFLYTSGTTGNPKGAMLTHNNLYSNAVATSEATETTGNDNTLCVLPMFHSFAWTCCVMMPLVTGGVSTILESFTPQTVLETIIKERTSIVALVPAMFAVLLRVPNINPDHFKHVRLPYSGGAALPVEILEKFQAKYGLNILEGYGLSECSPVAAVNPLKAERKPGSIGKAIPAVELKVVNDDDVEVAPNTPGELIIRGPNVMKGYYNLPEATEDALKNGWLHTGDIAYMDEEGYFFIVDRKKDMIIVSGLNVYPREIEEVLYTNAKVAEAAVVGESDVTRGEIVKAFITLKEGESASERELIKFCQERLANYKVPKKLEFREELPKTSTGKILKRALKS